MHIVFSSAVGLTGILSKRFFEFPVCIYPGFKNDRFSIRCVNSRIRNDSHDSVVVLLQHSESLCSVDSPIF